MPIVMIVMVIRDTIILYLIKYTLIIVQSYVQESLISMWLLEVSIQSKLRQCSEFLLRSKLSLDYLVQFGNLVCNLGSQGLTRPHNPVKQACQALFLIFSSQACSSCRA